MSSSTSRKRGDTAPPIVITCFDGDTPVDLTAAASIKLVLVRDGTVVDTPTVTGTADGVVSHPLPSAVTTEVGAVQCEVEVTWPDGTVQTFPAVGYLTVNVVADLG